MPEPELETCAGCGITLPQSDGPVHRYIGASPACWEMYSALNNAGVPPLAPAAHNALLTDAYAAQHPGVPSAQAIQSVAVHLLTLYGVLIKGVQPQNALWIRRRALRDGASSRHGRFEWLTPPSFGRCLTVLDIVQGATPAERTERIRQYIDSVWTAWAGEHAAVIAHWYRQYVVSD